MNSNINLKDYKLIKTLTEHENHITRVIILKDLRLCSSSFDGLIKIYDKETYETLLTIREHNFIVNYINQLKNNQLISCGNDKTIIIYDLLPENKYKIIQKLIGHKTQIFKVLESEIFENTLFSCCNNGEIFLWEKKQIDNNNYYLNLRIKCEDDKYSINDIIENKKRKILIGNCYPSKIVYFFNLNNNEFNIMKKFQMENYPNQIYFITEDILAITGKENIYLYNLDTYENYFIFKAKEWVTSFYTLSDGSILIGKGNGVEHVYYQTNENKLIFLESIDDKDNFWGVASIVENNKNDLIFGLRDRKIRIWSKN
jgi:WD40 repeat protein